MNDMKKVENYGIKWGPFTLKIPFIHIKFLTAEFLQGMVISGATAFAGAPVVMALGLSFEEAVACCFIASTLITAGPIIFGEPFAPGWVTPALPLVIAFFMSKGFFDGSYRVETFQYMAAMCIEFTAIILLLGMTGLGRVITEKIPNALKSGIILGAALAAFHQIFFSDYERYIGSAPISMIIILSICTITTFSEPFKRLAENNKTLKIIGSLGLLPGFLVAGIVGYFVGEISFDIQSGFFFPPVVDVYEKTSPLSIGLPPTSYYLEVFPLVIIGYLLLFWPCSWGLAYAYSFNKNIEIFTYDDHRMALSFAPLGLITPIIINDPDVVTKSFPNYWNDLLQLNFNLKFKK